MSKNNRGTSYHRHRNTDAFISNNCMRLDRLIEEILKWWNEKKLRRKILAYKERMNDKEE